MPHSVRVGDVEIWSLLDVGNWHIGSLFTFVPPDVWDTYRKIYPDALTEDAGVETSATCYAVRSGDSTMLIDAGLGPGPHPGQGNQTGQLLAELASAGIRPDDIDTVIVTHMHRDHVGWNGQVIDGQVRPTFPRARYLLPKKDWDHYGQPDLRARAAHLENTFALLDQGVIDLVDGERTVSKELTILPTPGHTPGHQAVIVVSGGERASIVGDLAHAPVQVHEVDWSCHYDIDPEQCRTSREKVFDDVEADHSLLCAPHFPHPGFGHLVRMDGRRIFQALPLLDLSPALFPVYRGSEQLLRETGGWRCRD